MKYNQKWKYFSGIKIIILFKQNKSIFLFLLKLRRICSYFPYSITQVKIQNKFTDHWMKYSWDHHQVQEFCFVKASLKAIQLVLGGALLCNCLSQGLPVTYPDPWGLRVTLPFMFPTWRGRETFGTFSPLAFDLWLQLFLNFNSKNAALFAAVGHYWIVHCTYRKEQCVVSVWESVIICCALFLCLWLSYLLE